VIIRYLSIASLAASVVSVPAYAAPSVFPTGTTLYQPAKAYNCFVLFGAPDGKTHLIDMNGTEVHRWEKTGFPSEMLDPQVTDGKLGHIAVQLENGKSPYGDIFANHTIGELDWEGKTVWEWGSQAPGGVARQNHDRDHLPNGDTIIVATQDRVVAGVGAYPIADQKLEEIAPSGAIVWSWSVGDHLDQFGIPPEGRDLLRKIYAKGGKGMGFLTINDMQPLGRNKWFEGGDARFNPDNIMIDSREASFVAIIEKKTGNIVWRLGPDYRTEHSTTGGTASVSSDLRPVLSSEVPRPVDQTSGQHDAHIIPEGLPGAGDLLVFDNEGSSGFPPTHLSVLQGSRVLEIDPIKKEIVWQYSAEASDRPIWSFFSSFISSARRLPNGNTLIDEGMNGRMFQVTPKGEIVWEYVNPYFGRQTLASDRKILTNWVYRAQPIPYTWVPADTPHGEIAVDPIDIATFRVPTQKVP
jgi:Arylsulfotransferase (ASST)